jgi:hypothetical protein
MLAGVVVTFEAQLWTWDARRVDTWVFVSLPAEPSEHIRELTADRPRGFGSVRVRATVGTTTWRTSIFPDAASGCYVLPVKRAVRTAESVEPGDTATVTVEIVDR